MTRDNIPPPPPDQDYERPGDAVGFVLFVWLLMGLAALALYGAFK